MSIELRPSFETQKVDLDQIIETRRQLAEIDVAIASLETYRLARLELDGSLTTKKKVFAGLDVAASRSLCDAIQDLLRDWNFLNENQVVEFKEAQMDIVVAGKPRQSNGKGLRGFLHSAFTIGLMRFCRGNHLPHPGFIVLDSPITSYREGKVHEAEDEATPEVQAAFWDSLAKAATDEQIIIIENKEPTDSARSLAHYIHFFGEKSEDGRRGFFPHI